LFAYLKPKIDTVLYNFFLGKYKKVWDEVKKAGEIKSDMYDKSGIINIIVLEIPKALNLTYSAYYELSESENKYFISTTTNANYYDGTIKELFFDHKLIQELYRTKSFLYLHALIKDEKNSEMSEVLKELKIDLCFPIFEKDLLLGVLVYGEKENSRFFNNEDLQILNSIIKDAEYQISNVLKVKHISETVSNDVLNKYKKTYQAQLLEESKRLGEIRNIKHFTEHSVKLVNRLLHTTQTNIYLYDEANNLYFNSNDKDCEQIAGSDYLIKYITEAKEIIFVEAFEKAVKEIKIKELVSAVETVKKMKASLIIPLMDFSRVLGFVTICNENNIDRKYSDDDLVLLGFVCDKIQTTLSNIYANEKANVDMLTSLHNRRYMMYRLESEVIRSYQEGLPLSFIMLDVDDFKFFNDAGGHHEGDLVLAQVADALQKLIRPTDECFRYGGDEFSIVFPDTDNEGVTSLANRLKLEFAEHENNEKLNEIFDTKVTLSIGASTYHPKNNNREYSLPEIHAIANFLIEKADTVLYDSKYEGKDRVSVSQPFSKVTYHIDLNKKEPEPIPREIDTLQYE
jgi:diguanylate cyclase (GGDEF)-like protein